MRRPHDGPRIPSFTGPGPWLAVAHSFGVLALLRHLVLVPADAAAATLAYAFSA
jgi:hypothetical protein